MRSPRRRLRGTLTAGTVSLALALSAVLVSSSAPAPVSAASYTGYAQGQVMATYDTISYPAMGAPKLKDNAPSVALAAYKGPLLVHANLNDAAVPSGLGLEWQCVELVQRYFYGKGWTTAPTWTWKNSAAADMPTGIPKNSNGHPEATFYKIGSLLVVPRAGDILVFGKVTGSWSTGHVALVTGVSSTRVTFIEQNVSLKGLGPIARDQVAITKRGSGLGAKFTIASTSLEYPGLTYPTVLGWIHAVKNTGTAPAAPALTSPGTTITFNSGSTWGAYTSDPAVPGATSLGNAEEICLTDTIPYASGCPAGAVSLGYTLGPTWTASRADIPSARWIWAPGVTGATLATVDPTIWLSTRITLGAPVESATIEMAADNDAQVWINGHLLASLGDVSPPADDQGNYDQINSFIIPASVFIIGTNTVSVYGVNAVPGYGPTYSGNPAGVVIGGTITTANVLAPGNPT